VHHVGFHEYGKLVRLQQGDNVSFFVLLTRVLYSALATLQAYTPVSLGGLGLTEQQIGTAIALSRISSVIVVQSTILPFVQTRVPNIRLFRAQMSLWPFIFFCYPCLNLIARTWGSSAAAAGLFALGVVSSLAETSMGKFRRLPYVKEISNVTFFLGGKVTSVLILNDYAPSHLTFGKTNGKGPQKNRFKIDRRR
jgi:hypothetical protein